MIRFLSFTRDGAGRVVRRNPRDISGTITSTTGGGTSTTSSHVIEITEYVDIQNTKRILPGGGE